MMKKGANLIFLLIIVLGLGLRLYKINIPLLEFYPTRQIQTADITRNFYLDGIDLLAPSVRYLGPDPQPFLVEFPAYNFLVALFYKIARDPNEIYGRLVSIIAWSISSIVLYKLCRKIVGSIGAIGAVCAWAFSPLSIMTSRSFQPDQLMITFSLLSIYLINRSLSAGSRVLWYLSAVFASLSILAKIHSAIFTLIPILYFLKKSGANFSVFERILYLFISCVPSLAWYFYAAVSNGQSVNLQNQTDFGIWFGPKLFLDFKYWSTMFGFEYNLVLLPVGITLFLAGVLTKLKKTQEFLYWYLAGVLVYFALFNRHSMTHEYYHLPLLPLCALFIGVAAQNLYNKLDNIIFNKNIFMLSCLFAIIIVSLPPTISRAYAPIDRFKYVQETARNIKALTKDDDLIIGAMDGGPALVYYSQRAGWLFDINRGEQSFQEKVFDFRAEITKPEEELETYRQKGAKIFASANKDQFLQNKAFAVYMYENYEVLVDNNRYVIFKLN